MSDNFIQVLNVSIQTLDCSILGEICKNQYFQNFSNKWKIPPKSYLNCIEIISHIANFHGRLLLNWLFVQFNIKKILLITSIFCCLHNWNLTRWTSKNSSIDITVMWEHLVCLKLQKFSPIPKTNAWFCCCRSIPLFFMYILSVGKPTFMMILNQMMDILWQTAASVANETTRSAWTFKLKFCKMRSTTCNRNALFAQIKQY